VEKKHFRIPLRVVFYQEEKSWVAHCLEFDLVGAGSDRDKAFASLNAAIATQLLWSLEKNDMGRLFSPAPGRYEEMFAESEDITAGEIQVSLFTPDVPNVQFEGPRFRSYQSRGNSDAQHCATV